MKCLGVRTYVFCVLMYFLGIFVAYFSSVCFVLVQLICLCCMSFCFVVIPYTVICFLGRDRKGVDLDERKDGRNWEELREGKL